MGGGPEQEGNQSRQEQAIAAYDGPEKLRARARTVQWLGYKETANITSAINQALHKGGISGATVDQVWATSTGRILGVIALTAAL